MTARPLRPRALVLYSRRVPGTRAAFVETLAAITGAVPPPGRLRGPVGRWFSFLDRNAYVSLSYVNDWLEALRASPDLDVEAVNIADLRTWPRIRRAARTAAVIVVLHSAAGDELSLVSRLAGVLQSRRGRLVAFFGNEYTLMPEKLAFVRSSGADYIASQLPPAAAAWLYAECHGAALLHAPAALNPKRYYTEAGARPIDIGFRGDLYPLFIGDDERTRILRLFVERGAAYGLDIDIAFRRIPGTEWRAFLNRCKGIPGAEAGTYFLSRDDALERAVREHLARHPATGFEDLEERFFADRSRYASGKAISSRHFEAIGTRTCQILLEGGYNGILEPDVHYLSLARDYSNLEDVIRRFKDAAERQRIVDAAHAHALAAHTYERRVADIVERLRHDGLA